ncbi:hypothetical protein GobsT_71480 [Gemmata obscuriglobus]|uniref:ParB/Sulfiredoxin domain-containing protein n=1 Tax=Gemmata obscuriglobus TaxID=114 RepID=A0A2Z3H6W5_9BACT|nr:hypothetical protein [Gemmata obscuriglobus]AWM41753.1 hypothetical protein C1280_35320 [Gemmata obscuriglobus]QEG32295.1 hypothetical protein GobsT_71480 [Gemmata obscuriglobus]VTS11651.1 unnamed protein product [Gemmata obscuriglobus UQM 2246]
MAHSLPIVRACGLLYQLPFADLIRPLTEREAAELRVSIGQHKKVLVRVVTYDSPVWGERCVIDGANRITIAAEMGLDLPVQHRGTLTDEQARAECLALNVDRRQLTREEQEASRARRLQRVVTARAAGASTRDIARAEGVSQTRVIQDLAKATDMSAEQGCSLAPLDRTLKAFEQSMRRLVCMKRPSKTAPPQPTGVLPDLLRSPHRARLERIASRHGVPLSGDSWPLMDSLLAVLADLEAEAATE